MEIAILAGGCFWCVEAALLRLRGVVSIQSGYIGGEVLAPTYEQVCSGTTGHAEAVRVEFEPNQLSYPELLEVFFHIHDPTTLNRQGADLGTQYRSAIFYLNDNQHKLAIQAKENLESSSDWKGQKFVTEIVPASKFYVAEEYHQNYFERNPHQPYCMAVIPPKLEKLNKGFSSRLK
jgi:peptide-methionine (S)-S-oxide reductase